MLGIAVELVFTGAPSGALFFARNTRLTFPADIIRFAQ